MFLKKITIVSVAILLGTALLTGCNNEREPEAKPDNLQTAGQEQEQPAQNAEQAEKYPLQIYFIRDNNGPRAVPVTREVVLENDDPAEIARIVLELLQAGPTEEEKDQGLFNNLPEAQLLDITVKRPHVILNFSREFEQIGGTYRVEAITRQLVMTMSAIPGIKSVILQVEGERVGTESHPYTGEGLLFGNLTMDPNDEAAASLGPADALDLFVSVIPDVEKMWALMGPNARDIYKEAGNIEYTAFSEGLGNWKDYQVKEEKIEGNIALVTINGDQELEGEKQPDANYLAYMVNENGHWKWDFPPAE